MVYFTADLHFYHDNVIKHTNRPYRDAEEMNRALVKNWNQKVSANDEIYILGDFTMKGPQFANEILAQLKGKKYLVRGNHDRFADAAEFDRSRFVWIRDYAQVTVLNTRFILFHYPIVEWHCFFRGSVHLHGHQHNRADYNINNMLKGFLRYDVGVDANGMAPVSAEEILAFFQQTRPEQAENRKQGGN